MNHKELTMWILLELDAAGSIDYLVTQRRCGFARDDRLGVNRGRFFSFWAASFRHLAAAQSALLGLSIRAPPLSRGMNFTVS